MTVRAIARLYLPLEVGAVGRITKSISREFPDATVAYGSSGEFVIEADPDITLTERKRAARERLSSARERQEAHL